MTKLPSVGGVLFTFVMVWSGVVCVCVCVCVCVSDIIKSSDMCMVILNVHLQFHY